MVVYCWSCLQLSPFSLTFENMFFWFVVRKWIGLIWFFMSGRVGQSIRKSHTWRIWLGSCRNIKYQLPFRYRRLPGSQRITPQYHGAYARRSSESFSPPRSNTNIYRQYGSANIAPGHGLPAVRAAIWIELGDCVSICEFWSVGWLSSCTKSHRVLSNSESGEWYSVYSRKSIFAWSACSLFRCFFSSVPNVLLLCMCVKWLDARERHLLWTFGKQIFDSRLRTFNLLVITNTFRTQCYAAHHFYSFHQHE